MQIIIFFYYNRMKYNLILFIFILLYFCYFYYFKYEKFINYKKTIKETNDMFLNNKNKIYKLNIIKKKEDINKCFKKCNPNDCIKLNLMKNNYDNCNKCQANENKCFNNLVSNGVCDPCGENLKKFNCNDLNYYSCPKLNDIYNKNGNEPYYLEVTDKNNITSPYNQSCLFCWNIKNYL
jgi:hypothetical protein